MIKEISLRKLILFSLAIILFIGHKIYLSSENDFQAVELFIQQLTRPDLHAIVKADFFQDPIIYIFEFLPYLRVVLGHDIFSFKDYYIKSIPNLNSLMPYVSLLSGVAMPGYVLFYNMTSIGAIIINTLFISVIYRCMLQSMKSRNIFLKIFYIYLLYVFSLSFLEDVNALYKLEAEIVFPVIAYLLLIFFVKKNGSRKVVNNNN